MSDINILELLRSKKNTTLSIITTHHWTDSYDCTVIQDGKEEDIDIISKPECLFTELDELLTRDDVTYQVTILPKLSLVISTREEEISISSTMLYNSDIFETNSCNVVVNTPSKILANIIEREIVPVKIQIQYQNISGRITITATDSNDNTVYSNTPEPMPWFQVQQSPEPVPFADTKEVKPKGYTNVVVGNEFELNPEKRQRNLMSEVMKHVENVANNDTRDVPSAEKALSDLHLTTNINVTEKEVEEHRKKIFAEGLKELAKEARRKEAESAEDDFAV